LLVQLWQDNGNFGKPGMVGASFQAEIGEKFRPIFWAYPDRLENALGDLSKGGLPEDTLKKYRQLVANLPGFNRADVLSKSQPTTKFASVSEDTIRKFISSSQELVKEWRLSGTPAGS
jgi:hypothetical protein